MTFLFAIARNDLSPHATLHKVFSKNSLVKSINRQVEHRCWSVETYSKYSYDTNVVCYKVHIDERQYAKQIATRGIPPKTNKVLKLVYKLLSQKKRWTITTYDVLCKKMSSHFEYMAFSSGIKIPHTRLIINVSDIMIEPDDNLVNTSFKRANDLRFYCRDTTRANQIKNVMSIAKNFQSSRVLFVTLDMFRPNWELACIDHIHDTTDAEVVSIDQVADYGHNTKRIPTSEIKEFILRKCNQVSTSHCIHTVNRLNLSNTRWSVEYDLIVIDSCLISTISHEQLCVLITLCKKSKNRSIIMVSETHRLTYEIYHQVVLPLSLNMLPNSLTNSLSIYTYPTQLEHMFALCVNRSKLGSSSDRLISYKPIESKNKLPAGETILSLNTFVEKNCEYEYNFGLFTPGTFLHRQSNYLNDNPHKTCKICFDRNSNTLFDCGHIGCSQCCLQIMKTTKVCPYCRKKVSKMFSQQTLIVNPKVRYLKDIMEQKKFLMIIVVCNIPELQLELFQEFEYNSLYECYLVNMNTDTCRVTEAINRNRSSLIITDSHTAEFLNTNCVDDVHLLFFHTYPDVAKDAGLVSCRLDCDSTVLYYSDTIESKYI